MAATHERQQTTELPVGSEEGPILDDLPGHEQDIDPAAWLAKDDSKVYGRVRVSGGYLKVAALTEAEYQALRKKLRKLNPANPRDPEGIVNNQQLSKHVIAYAINKANGLTGTPQEVSPDSLASKLTGDLIELMRGILRLSGMVDDAEREDPIPFSSS